MMRFFPVLILLFIGACSAESPGNESANTKTKQLGKGEIIRLTARPTPHLEPLWIAEGFSSPEGVAETPNGDFFISNVSGEATDKDGSGWISILNPEGDVTTPRFIEGLDAPKGMAVMDGALYVTDIDMVRIFDASTGEARGIIPIEGTVFLNDATAWQGAVYVSDSGTARIFKLGEDSASIWLADERLGGVNGLLADGETMLISTMDTGSLIRADSKGTLTELAKGMIDADGIGMLEGGGWLVSSWPGEIYYAGPNGMVTSLVNTRDAGINQNDLSVFGDLVIIPNWQPGTVTAWRVKR